MVMDATTLCWRSWLMTTSSRRLCRTASEGLLVNQILVADRGGKDVRLEQKALGELDQGGAIGYGVDVAVFELVEQFT